MLGKALKLVTVLVLAGLAAGLLPENCVAMQGEPATPACARSGSSQIVAGAADSEKAASRSLPAVCGVSIQPESNGAALIDISTSQPIPYHLMRLGSPERLVVDFEGARNEVRRGTHPAQSAILKSVRIAQWRAAHPAVVRVVADLAGSPTFAIRRQTWGVRVELKPRVAQIQPPAVPDPFKFRSRGKRYSAEVAPSKGPSPRSELPVHQFADLSASLTTPELPRQDRLVPLVNRRPLEKTRAVSGKMALVYGVSIKPNADGETLVDIASSQSVPYRVFQLTNPLRLVVDLKNARDAGDREVYPVESRVLKRVRVGQWRSQNPAVVRIVADLKGSPLFDVHARQPGIRIELKPRPAPGSRLRNPFDFTRKGPKVALSRPSVQAAYAPAARTMPSPQIGSISLLGLKVMGYLQKSSVGTEAIISDNLSIYFVPEGGAFADRFRLLKITSNAVEVKDLNTNETAWLQFTP